MKFRGTAGDDDHWWGPLSNDSRELIGISGIETNDGLGRRWRPVRLLLLGEYLFVEPSRPCWRHRLKRRPLVGVTLYGGYGGEEDLKKHS